MEINFVNAWIRAGKTPEKKRQRRLIVAGVCVAAAIGCAFAFPVGLIGTFIFGGIALVKFKNAATDET